MDKEDREWVLQNVETINADTNDIDELCCALEHSTIFATEHLQTFATNLIKLDFENKDLQQRIDKAVEYIENNTYFKDNVVKTMIFKDYSNNLLNILKGDDTNE